MKIKVGRFGVIISILLLASRVASANECEVYPIALSEQSLIGVSSNTLLSNVLNGSQPGNFGWLTWAGSPSVPTLVASLTPPGNSQTYVNPDHPDDHVISIGDWVQGKPGVSNSKNVRDALDALKSRDITVPVWDQTRGQGNNADYRVCAYARFRLISYNLSGQSKITARFLGYAASGAQNQPPAVSAGEDQTLSWPDTALLNGAVTDDGLPAGSTTSVEWSVVSGPGSVSFSNRFAVQTMAAFSTHGEYVLRLTASDSLLSARDEVTIVLNQANEPPQAFPLSLELDEDVSLPITLAGADPEGAPLDFVITRFPAFGQLTGAPPHVVYAPTNDYFGADSFAFKVSDGELESAPAEVALVILPVNDAPIVEDQSVTLYEDGRVEFFLNSSDVDSDVLSFEIVRPPLFGTLSALVSNRLVYTPVADYYGEDEFAFVASDGWLTSATATVMLVVLPVNDAPVVFAGPDQLIDAPQPSQLAGSVTDDATPGGPLMFSWSKVSGPGVVSFDDPHASNAVATFSVPGVYVLRMEVSDGELSGADEVTISINAAPMISLASSRMATTACPVRLSFVVVDDGLGGPVALAWSQVSGPAPVFFQHAGTSNALARFDAPGEYVVRLSASDGRLVAQADVAVSARPQGPNLPPAVSAGPDLRVGLADAVQLQGALSDDGLPWPSSLTAQWSLLSGPAPVVFSNANSPTSSVTFSQSGVYVFRLVADDSELTSESQVSITVYRENLPPQVVAGAAQTLDALQTELRGQVQDDGRPEGAPLQTQWTVLYGAGNVVFGDSNAPITTVLFSQNGEYGLRLSASDGEFSAADTVQISVVGNQPPQVSAGEDQVLALAVVQAITNEQPLIPSVADTWQYELGQPGLTGLFSSGGYVSVSRNSIASDGTNVYVGGIFNYANGVEVYGLARWDGCSWSPLYDPDLVDCGGNDIFTPGFVARTVGIGNPSAGPVASRGAEVFVGGYLKDLADPKDGAADASGRWDGEHWREWGFKHGPIADIWAICAASNAIYVGGPFTRCQPVQSNLNLGAWHPDTTNYPFASCIIKWDGSNWQNMGKGIYNVGTDPATNYAGGAVSAIAVDQGGHVFAGGRFAMQTPSGIATNLAHWDGTQWLAMGRGIQGYSVNALLVDEDGSIYVAGSFTNAGGVTARNIAKVRRDPDTGEWVWFSLGQGVSNGVNNVVEALVFYDGKLCVGGRFTHAGNRVVNRLAAWDGTNWMPFISGTSNGVIGQVMSLAAGPDGLYVGGYTMTSAGGKPVGNIARWGQPKMPSLVVPEPVLVYADSLTGAVVSLTALAGHPCGAPLSLTWNVDGGPAEHMEVLNDGETAPPATVEFSHHYAPGLHQVTITLDNNGRTPPLTGKTMVLVLAPVETALLGEVSDDGLPAGGTLTSQWTLISGPGPVTFQNPSAPLGGATFNQIGTYVIRLTANDGELATYDEVTIHIQEAGASNFPPSVVAGRDQLLWRDEVALLQGSASDDGLPSNSVLTVAWSKAAGPGEVAFDDTASLSATASFSEPGVYVLRLSASDGEFTSHADLTITVRPEVNQPPMVSAGPDQTLVLPYAAHLQGACTDDGLPFGILNTQWRQVSGPGFALIDSINGAWRARFSQPGVYVLELFADDGRATSQDEVTITVYENIPPPVVEILEPGILSTLTAPTPVLGTAHSPILAGYALEIRAIGASTNWNVLTNGLTSVLSGPLGQLDPTLALNGLHEIRLTAVDLAGQRSETEPVPVVFDRNMKIGLFNMACKDATIPLPGFPIEVERVYDSRYARNDEVGDFGLGWHLAGRNIRLRKSYRLDRGWVQTTTGGTWPIYSLQATKAHWITITFPDGQVYRFEAVPDVTTQPLIPITYPAMNYISAGPSHGELSAIGSNRLAVVGSVPGVVDLYDLERVMGGSLEFEYNPAQFQFTAPNGLRYVIDEKEGLKSVTDLDGNTLTYSHDGITHSSGLQVRFIRDSSGRISALKDPNGQLMTYTYDSNGRLEGMTDASGRFTRYAYNDDNLLVSMLAPGGYEKLRNVYDEMGRLVGQQDALGGQTFYGHELDARREVVSNRLGHVTVYDYDEDGNVVRISHPDRGEETMAYDENGNLIEHADPLGHQTIFAYDALNNCVSVTDPLGRRLRFTYNGLRRVTSVTDPRGGVITNQYDGYGHLLSTRDPQSGTTKLVYDERGRLTTITNALGHGMSFAYDVFGRVTEKTFAEGNAVSFLRDANGNVISESMMRRVGDSALLLETHYAYNASGWLTNALYPDGSFLAVQYDAEGRVVAFTDALNRRTECAHDEMGRLLRVVFPDGATESFGYDAEGRRIAETNRLGDATRYVHDEQGRLRGTLFPDGSTISNLYDQAGRLLAAYDEKGQATLFEYDELGRLIATGNALNQWTTNAYDANGNLISVTDPLGRTTCYEYDACNRQTAMVFADASRKISIRDALGRVLKEVGQDGAEVSFGYDALGRLVAVTNEQGAVTTFERDEWGNPLTQRDANGAVTRYEYDRMGRRTRRILPNGDFERYAYDLAGNLTNKADFNGRVTVFEYDGQNRLVMKRPDPFFAASNVVFAYDSAGRRTEMRDQSGITSYRYDARGRLLEKTAAHGSLYYAYDAAGCVTNIRSSHENGVNVSYAYDLLNRLRTLSDPRQGLVMYQYDPAGNLAFCVFPNGLSQSYEYSSLNRLTNLTVRHLYAPVAGFGYALNQHGQKVEVREHHGRTVRFGYDAARRLTNETIAGVESAGTLAYSYDPVGNRLSRFSSVPQVPAQTYGHDANDRLLADAYDANGNTISGWLRHPYSGADYFVEDVYDFENRLIRRQAPHGVVQVLYDGDGQRVEKTVNGGTTRYLVDDRNPTGYAQVLEELASISPGLWTPSMFYVHGLDLVAQAWPRPGEPSLQSAFYLHDGMGSVRFLASADGQLTDAYDYDAFGMLVSRQVRHPGSNSLVTVTPDLESLITSNRYLYGGEQFDPDLDLYCLRARYLDPNRGRFWTMDDFEGQASIPATLHKYAYAHNDPVNLSDPSGCWALGESMTAVSIAGVAQHAVSDFWKGTMTKATKFNVSIALENYSLAAAPMLGSAMNMGADQGVIHEGRLYALSGTNDAAGYAMYIRPGMDHQDLVPLNPRQDELFDVINASYGLGRDALRKVGVYASFLAVPMASASRRDTLNVDLDVVRLGHESDSLEIVQGGIVCVNCSACLEEFVIAPVGKSWEGEFLLTLNPEAMESIRVYRHPTGGLPMTFNGQDNKFPFSTNAQSFWVQGVKPSARSRDMLLTLTALPQIVQDRVSLTSVKIESVGFKGGGAHIPLNGTAGLEAKVSPPDRRLVWEILSQEEGLKAILDKDTGVISTTPESKSGKMVVRVRDALNPSCFLDTRLTVGCSECVSGDCSKEPGGLVAKIGSLDVDIGLGLGLDGYSAGSLFIWTNGLSPAVYTPSGLSFSTLYGGSECIRQEGVIRQVVAPKCFADVLPLNASAYELRFFKPSARGAWDETNACYLVYDDESLLLCRIRVENPDASGASRLRLTSIKEGHATSYLYSWNEVTQEWTLSRGNGLQVEQKRHEQLDQEEWEIRTLQDADGHIAQHVASVYQEKPWGRSIVREITDPSGVHLVTTYSYEEAPSSPGYGRPRLIEYPDGSWVRYLYDAQARVTNDIRGWGNAGPNAPVSGLRVIHYSYASVASSDAQSPTEFRRPRMTREVVQGVEVRRTYAVYAEEASGERTEITEQCLIPGTAYGASNSLRTVRVFYPYNSETAQNGRLKSAQYSDGRLDSWQYEFGTLVPSANPSELAFVAGNGRARREIVTHGLVSAPSGVPFKSTREITLLDEFGSVRFQESQVFANDGYVRIGWTANDVDEYGHTIRTSSSDGRLTETIWGCCGRESQTDAQGLRTDYVYDDLKQVVRQLREGVASQSTYDAAGRKLREIVSAGGESLISSNQYDGAGRLVKSVDSVGLETQYAYTQGGRITTVTLPGGAMRITENDLDGRLKSVRGTAVVPQTYAFGVNPDGTQWSVVYVGPAGVDSPAWEKTTSDCLGRAIRTERPGPHGVVLTNRNDYNAIGRLIRTETPGAPATLFEYDELGNQTRSGLDVDGNGVLEPASSDVIRDAHSGFEYIHGDWWSVSSSAMYPEEGQGTILTNGIRRQRLTGLGTGQPVLVSESVAIDALGNQVVQRAYLDRPNKTSRQVTDTPDSDLDAETLMSTGLVRWTRSATGVEQMYEYDTFGRPIAVIDLRTGTNWTHYDSRGRVDYTEDSAGNRTTFTYDPATGRHIATTDALTNTTHTAYDIQGRVIATWGATYPVAYDYDAFGRMAALYTYRGSNVISDLSSFSTFHSQFDRTTWFYDLASGLLTNKLYADGKGTTYTYDNVGRLASRRWARGVVTTYGYNLAGSLTNISYSDSTPSVAFTYDRLGRQHTITDAAGPRFFSYDESLQLTSEVFQVSGLPFQVSREYDSLGRPSGLSLGNYAVSYGYDSFGRFSLVSAYVDSVPYVANYSYLPSSDLLSGYTNNAGVSVTRVYEPDRNLIASIQNCFNGAVISTFDYENDAIGRRTKRVDSSSTTNAFGYNIRSELIEAVMGTNSMGYQYDPIGNREWTRINATTNSYLVNELNQYTHITNQQSQILPTYDEDGNMLTHNGWTFTWDAENRLIMASNGTTVVQNTYDYMSRRVRKTTGSTSTSFLYDGWNLISETQVSGITSQVSFFLWGLDLSGTLQGAGGIGGLLQIIPSTGGVPEGRGGYVFSDANGNVTELLSTNGTLTAHYEYDPFGNVIKADGPEAWNNPYRFSTKYQDDETGLLYYGYRFYSPEMGRWLSRDPIEEFGGINLRLFIGNMPLNNWDLLGLTNDPGEHGWKVYDPYFMKDNTVPNDSPLDCDAWKTALRNARLAAAAYDLQMIPTGWKEIESSHRASGLDYSVFSGPNAEIVISFRGTTDTPDWRANITQTLGLIGLQYSEVRKLDKLAEKYPNAIVTGHSLGGALASAFGTRHRRSTTTFNAAGVHVYTGLAYGFVCGFSAKKYVRSFFVAGEILNTSQDLSLLPNALGQRVVLFPDLLDNVTPLHQRSFLEMAKDKYIGHERAFLSLSVSLHSMKEVIEALEARISKECCK